MFRLVSFLYRIGKMVFMDGWVLNNKDMTKLSGFSTLYCTLYGCHFGSYEPHIFFIPGAWPLHGSVGYMNRVIKIPVLCYLLLLLEESSLQDFPSFSAANDYLR